MLKIDGTLLLKALVVELIEYKYRLFAVLLVMGNDSKGLNDKGLRMFVIDKAVKVFPFMILEGSTIIITFELREQESEATIEGLDMLHSELTLGIAVDNEKSIYIIESASMACSCLKAKE